MTYVKGGAGKGPSRLQCDGQLCGGTAGLTGGTAAWLRERSRAAGWLTTTGNGRTRDLCPKDRPASVGRPR